MKHNEQSFEGVLPLLKSKLRVLYRRRKSGASDISDSSTCAPSDGDEAEDFEEPPEAEELKALESVERPESENQTRPQIDGIMHCLYHHSISVCFRMVRSNVEH